MSYYPPESRPPTRMESMVEQLRAEGRALRLQLESAQRRARELGKFGVEMLVDRDAWRDSARAWMEKAAYQAWTEKAVYREEMEKAVEGLTKERCGQLRARAFWSGWNEAIEAAGDRCHAKCNEGCENGIRALTKPDGAA